ncbi:proteasome subunit beta [Halosolutus halophilus]|uniref:proteasome subunit beta n=1 Tax=Halosolutus halophilus TaxID=1552990 RepID=UPI002234F448|nr:proteasome subunit beta [Halosolutus halophilus]
MNSRSDRLRTTDEGGYSADGGEIGGGILVGVRTTDDTDGVVLAADTRTSRDAVVTSDEVRKIAPIRPFAAIGSTTHLGDAEPFVHALRAEVDRYEDRHGRHMTVPALATFAGRELRSRPSLDATFVLGGVDEAGSHVFTVGADEGVVEADYAAEGSGHQVAYGVLDRGYGDSLALGEARDLVVDAIESAGERDPRTGPAVHLVELVDGRLDSDRYDSVDAARSDH